MCYAKSCSHSSSHFFSLLGRYWHLLPLCNIINCTINMCRLYKYQSVFLLRFATFFSWLITQLSTPFSQLPTTITISTVATLNTHLSLELEDEVRLTYRRYAGAHRESAWRKSDQLAFGAGPKITSRRLFSSTSFGDSQSGVQLHLSTEHEIRDLATRDRFDSRDFVHSRQIARTSNTPSRYRRYPDQILPGPPRYLQIHS